MSKPKAKQTDDGEQAPTVSAVTAGCGHVNKQFYDFKGALEDLACDLPAGHAGDHHAKYQMNVGDPQTDEKGRVVKTNYHQEEADAYWNEAAGKPLGYYQTRQADVEQMSLFQKDIVMQVMGKNPALTAEEAIAIAKTKPEWNAASQA